MKFWGQFDKLQEAVESGEESVAAKIAYDLYRDEELLRKEPNRKLLLDKVCAFHGLSRYLNADASNDAVAAGLTPPFSLDKLVSKVKPGTSVVTSCMNRNDNLLKALPSWLACKEVSEVIIVDWSSETPVIESLSKSNISDPRIRVVRVDGESRWVLSYAFNIGFRAASFEKILKTDADINLSPDFFEKNHLAKDEFIAGDWRVAEKGQEFINGFFYIGREDLLGVNGFNEYITTYGWDDDDIYGRLVSSGLQRRCVDVGTIFHLPHDDSQRIGEFTSKNCNLEELRKSTKFKIRANRFVAQTMPTWNSDRIFLPFNVVVNLPGYIHLEKAGDSVHYVPSHIQDDAFYYAEVELASWRAGLRAFDLDRVSLRRLLRNKHLDSLTKLDIELGIYNPSKFFNLSQYNVVVFGVEELAKQDKQLAVLLIENLQEICEKYNIGLVVAANSRELVADLLPNKSNVAFVPSWRNIGNIQNVAFSELEQRLEGSLEADMKLSVSEYTPEKARHYLESLPSSSPIIRKNKIFVDAQHGLGNRLRAIASGAAIARSTDRQLVVVWEPDAHCECRFKDLFEYGGEVVENSFLSDAQRYGMSVFNYMEIEPGAVKDQQLVLADGKDLYARSAYVLKSEHSGWDRENKFLRELRPNEEIVALLSGFDNSRNIGAHVRMEAGRGLDHNVYDSADNWLEGGHEELHFWREKSHYSNFIKRIDEYFLEDPNLRLYLATDMAKTYEIFSNYYGDRVSYLKRDVYDRSKTQIQYALADAILLSNCKKLLGSTWSSFSELAMRLSTSFSNIEMSGTDF